jgi:hypothetical protein
LARQTAKLPIPKANLTKPVLPSLTIALEKLTDYVKKTKNTKTKKESASELSLTKWYSQDDRRESDSTPKQPLQLTPIKSQSMSQPAKEDDFPTLKQTAVMNAKRLLLLDETETSGNQSSEVNRERDTDMCLANLSTLDLLIFQKLKALHDSTTSRVP